MTADAITDGIHTAAVIGPGRIGRQIALAFALAGCRVLLVDLKERASDDGVALVDARREITRDLRLMTEEGVVDEDAAAAALERLEPHRGIDGLRDCGFVQE